MFRTIKISLFTTLLAVTLIPSTSFAQAVSDVDTSGSVSGSSCVTINNNLSYKNRKTNNKEDVMSIQDFLNSAGYLSADSVTGFFGKVTEKAVAKFQDANGLVATPPGFVGAGTRAKVNELSCNGTTAQAASVPRQTQSSRGAQSVSVDGCSSGAKFSSTTGLPCTTQATTTDTTISCALPATMRTCSDGSSMPVNVGGICGWREDLCPKVTKVDPVVINKPTNGFATTSISTSPNIVSISAQDSNGNVVVKGDRLRLPANAMYIDSTNIGYFFSGSDDISFNVNDLKLAPGVHQFKITNQAVGDSNVISFNVTGTAASLPSVTMRAPNGGETISFGSPYQVTWSPARDLSSVQINIVAQGVNSPYGGPAECAIATGILLSSGSFTWTPKAADGCFNIPGGLVTGLKYKLAIKYNLSGSDSVILDESDNAFTFVSQITTKPCLPTEALVGGKCIPAPTLDFYANGTAANNGLPAASITITEGQPVLLKWNSTNSVTCQAYGGWQGLSKETSNLVGETFYPTTDTLYTLTCGNFGAPYPIGTSKSISVKVTPKVSQISFGVTSGWNGGTVTPNQINQKIGSFTVQANSQEAITISNILVGLDGSMITNHQLTNLRVNDIGIPVGNPVFMNNYAGSVTIPASTSKTFDVYADIGSTAAGLVITPIMTLTYKGATSNITTLSVPVTGPVVSGASLATIGTGDVTLVSGSSAVGQFIIGGQSAFAIGTFNFKATGGNALVKDITVTVPANTINSVTINGVSAPVIGSTASLSNVGLNVPSGSSGVNVPMVVSLSCVNAAGGCAGVSGADVNARITNVTYNNGSAVVSVSPTSATTNTFKLVASKPTISMPNVSRTDLANGTVKIGEFTISADAGGDIKLNQIPVSINTSGFSITPNTVELRDSTGNIVIVGSAGTNGSTQLTGSGAFVLSTPRIISRGTSETYTVWAKVTGVAGAAGTMSTTFSFGDRSIFLWTDVIGGNNQLNGLYMYGYPSGTYTVTNPATKVITCSYPAPPIGCNYIPGANYDPVTSCGMELSCIQVFSPGVPTPTNGVKAGVLGVSTMCVDLTSNMHRGAEDTNVKKLQTFLIKKGLFVDDISGFYGDKTVQAVGDYQLSKGLPVTGMVYDFTRDAIRNETCK